MLIEDVCWSRRRKLRSPAADMKSAAKVSKEINDLATSPANPQLIASASDDTTVRIWSLDPIHAKQPCVYLLGGEGHSWNLLSVVCFHQHCPELTFPSFGQRC